MKNKELIQNMLKDCCIIDIETSSFCSSTNKPINIRTDFDKYVENAKVKWIGIYSYKYKKYLDYNAITQREEIIQVLNQHNTFIGFNSEKFDIPVTKKNNLLQKKWFKQIDIQVVLGNNKIYGHKFRANYMGIDLKPIEINGKKYGPNTLMSMAKHFDLEVLKGDIDYKIFHKEEWNEEETLEIKKYLRADVLITKKLFEKAINFWTIFTDWLYEEDIKKWTWLRSSMASLTYSAACRVKGVKTSFSNDKGESEEMGGRAIIPPQEETFGADYLDEASKYPHTFAEFNLFSEVDVSSWSQEEIDKEISNGNIWHGNEKFQVKGYYDIKKQGVMEKDIINKLKTRWEIKKILKNFKKTGERNIIVPEILKDLIPNNILTDEIVKVLNGLQYAIKIFANSLYGAVRSKLFEKIHTKNAGWDCCWIGQQIHEYVEEFFVSRGFKIIGGFTDSWFFESREGYNKNTIMNLANECMAELKKYMLFPADTHIIDHERFIDYIVYSYDEKKGKYKKNNYAFISEGKVKIVGFPIKKNNATKLAIHIFKKYLEPEGIKKNNLKFEKKYIEKIIKEELEQDITLSAINYNCNSAISYKKYSQIQAQISRAYLDNLDGSIDLIPNTKYGKAGKGNKYCTIQESFDNNIEIGDLILDKVWNELSPFIIEEKPINLEDFGM